MLWLVQPGTANVVVLHRNASVQHDMACSRRYITSKHQTIPGLSFLHLEHAGAKVNLHVFVDSVAACHLQHSTEMLLSV